MIVRLCPALAWLAALAFVLSGGGCSSASNRPPEQSAPPPTNLAATRPAGGVTESLCESVLAWFDDVLSSGVVERMVPAAEAAAERLIAGGTLYAAGNQGFCDELFYRAGGFPFTAIWGLELPEEKDVVLVGLFRPDGEDFEYGLEDPAGRRRTFGGAMVVHFAGHDWPVMRSLAKKPGSAASDGRLRLIDTHAPRGDSLQALCLGQLATTALAWAFHGEVIAAATRKGKTLATFASDWEPDGPEWDESVKGHHVHPTYKVPPIPAGRLGRQYLTICRGQIAEFLATQPAQVRLAARRLAGAIRAGGKVYVITNGHIHPRGSVVPPALPRVVMCGREGRWHWISHELNRGDVLLWMGYLRYPRGPIEQALETGAGAVSVSVDAGPTDDRRVHVRSCWKDWDTVIDLPKYPIRVLPSSGTVQTAQWYALMAETLAAYKAKPP